MRVAFCGASGTGKSTLAAWVAETYGLPINPVGSRSVAKMMGYDNPYDVDKAGRREEFQALLLAEKIRWEAEHESFVVDRTTFDNLAYLALHQIEGVTDAVWDQTLQGAQRYTHIVYCPLRAFINLDSDPARVSNKAYHRVYDALIASLVRPRAYTLRWVELEFRQKELGVLLDSNHEVDTGVGW